MRIFTVFCFSLFIITLNIQPAFAETGSACPPGGGAETLACINALTLSLSTTNRETQLRADELERKAERERQCETKDQSIKYTINGREETYKCKSGDLGTNAEDNPEKICKDSYEEYGLEIKDKNEKAETKITERMEKIRELENEAFTRKQESESAIEDIDEVIAETSEQYTNKVEELQKALDDSSVEGATAIQELLQAYQDTAIGIQDRLGNGRNEIIDGYEDAVRKYLAECDGRAQEQIVQAVDARNKGVQARASGQSPIRNISSNFNSLRDFDRIKLNVNEELARCRAGKQSLAKQANRALDAVNTEVTKKDSELKIIKSKLEQAQEIANKDSQRLVRQIQQADAQHQAKMQRLEQKKIRAQQNYLQRQSMDDQQLAQLRNEQYGATPLLGQGPISFGANPRSGNVDSYSDILLSGVKDECCNDNKTPKFAKRKFSDINRICKQRDRRGSRATR